MYFINKLNNDEFEKVYNILSESFPIEEYRTKEDQKVLLHNDKYNIAVYKNDENEIIGLIAYYDFKSYIHMEHFAVSKSERGNGIGRKFLGEFKKAIANDITLEVELPQDNISKGRIEFYKSMGFKLYNYEYFQPPLRKGFDMIPLMIMTDISDFSKDKFNKIKKEIYSQVYNFYE